MAGGSFTGAATDEPFPGVHRAAFSSEQATVTRYVFDPGARFPVHAHPQEQITLVEEGEVVFTAGGEPRRMVAGDWSVVAPNVDHGLGAGDGGARILCVVVPRRRSPGEYSLREDGSP
ncbi:MAG: cupin domain-containing protein [Solirubrobacteraceae bacterium]|jgi:quercetin dioxygenase-like cupin family protein